MMQCQQCRHTLPDGSLFCDNCGASLLPGDQDNGRINTPLPAPITPPGAARVAARPTMPPLQQDFAHYSFPPPPQPDPPAPAAFDLRPDYTPATPAIAINAPHSAFSASSAATFDRPAPASASAARAQAASDQAHAPQAIPAKRIRLTLTNGKFFDLSGQAEYLIGRRDPQTPRTPDVDLADWNGAACGVSRAHASIHATSEGLFIEDLESLNETIRNGFRLLPRQWYPLENEDLVRLGSIQLRVLITDL